MKNEALKQHYEQHKKYWSKANNILEGGNAMAEFPILQHVVTIKIFEFP